MRSSERVLGGVGRRAAPIWAAGTVFLLVLSACSRPHKVERWGELEYDPSQSRSPAEQVAAQRAMQSDASAIIGPNEVRRGTLFNDTLTEQQRRDFQRREGELLRDRAEQHQAEAQRRRQETLAAQRAVEGGGGRR